MPLSSLPVIARYLGVSIEELLGEPPSAAAKKRGPTPRSSSRWSASSSYPRPSSAS
jgi:hypothetical protein